jgi:hypothetical protein
MKPLSLAFALVGVLTLGAAQTTGFATDLVAPGAAPRHVRAPHWRVVKRVVVPRCVEVSQPPRGCPLRRHARLVWPGVPRFDEEPAYYAEPGWHRCWWGEWC